MCGPKIALVLSLRNPKQPREGHARSQVRHAMQVVRPISLSAFHSAKSNTGLGTSFSVVAIHQLL